MAEDDELEGLEDELAELEEELADLEDDPSDAPEPGDEPDGAPEPSPEEPEPGPEPAAAEQEDPPWDHQGDSWTAEGEATAGEDTVIVRRLDADGNVVEERRGSREDLPREERPAAPNPPPNPEPGADPGDDDEESRSWLVLLLVGILLLAVVGAGVAYLALGDDGDGGIGGGEGPTAAYTRSPGGTVATGTQITFDASGSTIPEGASPTYEWDFGDGETAQGEEAVHVYASAGTYEVELLVTADGRQSTTTKEVTVVEAPEAQITVEVNGSEVGTDNPILNGTEVTFSGADSTADAPITSYAWTIDGSTATGADVTSTFPEPGAKPVELTVETEDGFTDTASVTVGVGYETQFSDTLPAAVLEPSEGPPHNFTVGHDALVPSRVEATLNYSIGDSGPLQDPTPAQLNVTDGAGQQVATATGSDGLATATVDDAGQFVPGAWTARATQDQGGAQKSYTLTVVVQYPTR